MFVAVEPISSATATMGITVDGVKSTASSLMDAASKLGSILSSVTSGKTVSNAGNGKSASTVKNNWVVNGEGDYFLKSQGVS